MEHHPTCFLYWALSHRFPTDIAKLTSSKKEKWTLTKSNTFRKKKWFWWASGNNSEGEFGLGYKGSYDSKWIRLPFSTSFTQMSAGYGFVIALDKEGLMWTWGQNDIGQLGLGDLKERKYPAQVLFPKTTITYAVAGIDVSAAITTQKDLFMTGNNRKGSLGVGSDIKYSTLFMKVPSLNNVLKIECGYNQIIALTANVTWIWGHKDTVWFPQKLQNQLITIKDVFSFNSDTSQIIFFISGKYQYQC